MSVYGNTSDNPDKSKNHSTGFVRQEDAHSVSGSMFVNGYKEKDARTGNPMGGTTFGSAGASLGVENSKGAASITAQHIPKFGNNVTGAGSLNFSQGPNHNVGVNTFTTAHFPKSGPNYMTHGAGISADVGKVGAHASVAHTPMFKATEYSVGGRMNLHQSPTGSANLNLGASKMVTPHSSGNWQPGVLFNLRKDFEKPRS